MTVIPFPRRIRAYSRHLPDTAVNGAVVIFKRLERWNVELWGWSAQSGNRDEALFSVRTFISREDAERVAAKMATGFGLPVIKQGDAA